MAKKIVVFGPWVGEFSYEVSWWIPEIRKIRLERLADFYAVHVGFIGRAALYKDFIDDYVPYPKTLHNSILYPSMIYTIVDGYHIFPEPIKKFFQKTINKYRNRADKVIYCTPNPKLINKRHQDNPVGVYRQLVPDKKSVRIIKEEFKKFDRKRDVVAVNVYSRKRKKVKDTNTLPEKTWNPKSWADFITRIVKELDVNVCLFGVPQRDLYPGSLTIKDLPDLKRLGEKIISLVSEEENSIELQAAILKNTVCSVWGATGAVVLAFLTNTPVFSFQAKEWSPRLEYEWEKRLTNDHKNVRLFSKYSVVDLWDAPVDDVFNDFKSFYNKIK